MITVTKRINFCAAHRLSGYIGACSNLHGHNYKLDITIGGNLNDLGMVVDFKEIRNRIGDWINDNWDHGAIFRYDDPFLKISIIDKSYAMEHNPTAENMLVELRDIVVSAFKDLPVIIMRLRLYETDDSYAEMTV